MAGALADNPVEDLEPFSLSFSLVFIFISCLIATDLKKRLALTALILMANVFAFVLLYKANSKNIWTFSGDLVGTLQFLVLSTISYLVTISMVSKIKTIAQSDLDLEIFWQERMKSLENASSMTNAMRKLSVGPVEAIKKDLEQCKQGLDQSVLDDLQKQIEELLLISQAIGCIQRSQSGQESLPTDSNPFLVQLKTLLSAKA